MMSVISSYAKIKITKQSQLDNLVIYYTNFNLCLFYTPSKQSIYKEVKNDNDL